MTPAWSVSIKNITTNPCSINICMCMSLCMEFTLVTIPQDVIRTIIKVAVENIDTMRMVSLKISVLMRGTTKGRVGAGNTSSNFLHILRLVNS